MRWFIAWLSFRMLRERRSWFLGQSALFSFLGLVLGVACLVVAMAVVSGFEFTLKKNLADSTGHISVFKTTRDIESGQEFINKIKESVPQLSEWSRFVFTEGILALHGHVGGIFIQGIESNKVDKVLNLRNRIKEGQFQLISRDDPEVPLALIGKGVASQFQLKPGDQFKIIIPVVSDWETNSFRRHLTTVQVAGILDFGKYEYDQRMIVMDMETAQKVAAVGEKFSGFILKLNDIDESRKISQNLSQILGSSYRIRDWRDINENLFNAISYEKIGIFFVIFIIVLAAAFNVSTSLYVNVVQRYTQISVLKTLGMTPKNLVKLFSWQGILLGSLGSLFGLLLGFIFCMGFSYLQNRFGLISESVYKIDHIELYIQPLDLFWIVFSTLLICFLATLAPAIRGAKSLSIVEGFRHV